MELTPELIGGLALALTGLISGITTILSKRSEDYRKDNEQLRKDNQDLRSQLRLADQWTFKMIRAMDQSGVQVPEPPNGLNTSGSPDDNQN